MEKKHINVELQESDIYELRRFIPCVIDNLQNAENKEHFAELIKTLESMEFLLGCTLCFVED